MGTFKIIGRTNGYIAGRDIHFNGKTEITIEDSLSHEKAIEKLNDMFFSDYEFAREINSEIEYVSEYFYSKIDEIASLVNLKFENYFEMTKNRWLAYSRLKAKEERFMKFTRVGFYDDGCLVKEKNDESYEFDSRYYSIEEEEENV